MFERLNLDVKELSQRRILIIAGALYVACLPIFGLAQWLYVPAPVPPGEMIEQLQNLKPSGNDGRYVSRTFRFVRERHIENGMVAYRDFTKPMPLVVYEDATELSPSKYQIQKLTPTDTWRYVWITSSDGTDPRRNGRRYYVVLPRQRTTESAEH